MFRPIMWAASGM